jgi:hypothetical protein
MRSPLPCTTVLAALLALPAGALAANAGTSTPSGGTAAPTVSTPVPAVTATTTTTPATSPPAATTTLTPSAAGTPGTVTAARAPATAHATTTNGGGGISGWAILAAVLGALVALGALVWAIFRFGAYEPHWLQSARHSFGEAGYRASETWAEFADWARIGH